MRTLSLFAAACLCVTLFVADTARAQRIDAAIGASTLLVPSSSDASGNHAPQTMAGGLYPDVTVNFFVRKHLGIDFDIAWRERQNLYQGFQPYRPLLYDLNAIWLQRVTKSFSAEILGGAGVQQINFYSLIYGCGFASCTNLASRSQFMGDLGGGIRYYIRRGLFIRPEAKLYLVRSNYEFSAGYATSVGVSVGYAIGPR